MFFKLRSLSGWGNTHKSSTNIATCVSLEDMKAALQNQKIIARGLGRSYADQATNQDNYALDFTSFNRFLSFDDTTGLLECEAGVSFSKIIRYMAPTGWFPFICPGTKFITIGGAIANDVHGKGHHLDGSFINCVESFRIMLADGKVREASRTSNPELFYANFGGLGLLGFLLSAKIRLRRINSTYFSKINIVAHNLDEMIENLNSRDQDYAFLSGWINLNAKGDKLGKGLLTLGNYAQVDELPFKKMIQPLHLNKRSRIKIPHYLQGFAMSKFNTRLLSKMLYYRRRSQASIVDYDRFFFTIDHLANWNRVYGKKGFVHYQFVLPFEDSCKSIKSVLEEVSSSEHNPFLSEIKKFGQFESGPFSFPREGYSIAIDFPFKEGIEAFIKKLNEMVVEVGGRIYLTGDTFLVPEQFKQMYPRYEEWLKVKEKYDPDNVFSSDLSRRIGLC